MSRVRGDLERIHTIAARMSGRISLRLTGDTLTKRDVVGVLNDIEQLERLANLLRAEVGIKPKE